MIRRLLGDFLLMVGALAGFLVVYGLPMSYNQGPAGRWWESLRRYSSRLFGRVARGAGPRPITHGEYAGRLDRDLNTVERQLYEDGFVRNPTSRLKTRDGDPEDGSWVYRESPLSPVQLHLMLFANGDGTVDVYAHEELSSVNPLCGPAHFRGSGQSVAPGVFRARESLRLDTCDAPTNPPKGAYSEWEP